MEDLQKLQNGNSCKLSMPEGLKSLMFDISREVLRAQPENVCQFVAEYLSAMLVARDSLHVASHVCDHLSLASGPLQLHRHFKEANLTEDEEAKAQQVVNEYLEDNQVTKENLSTRLMEANIDKSKISSIKRAVEAAFKRKIIEEIPPLDIQFNYNPEARNAAASTLELYCRPVMTVEEYHSPAKEIKVPDGDHKSVQIRSRKSSTDSSDDIFENIQYDGGIEDLYVSGNNRPYTNSSLTSLAGSNGLAKYADREGSHAPEMEGRVISYDEDETHADDHLPQRPQTAKGQAQVQLSHTTNSSKDEVLLSVDDEFDTNTGNEAKQGASTTSTYEDEVIEEESVLDAENESDEYVHEEFE